MSNPGPASATSPNLVSPLQFVNIPSRTMLPLPGHMTAISAPGLGSMSLNYVPVSDQFSASRVDILMQLNMASSATTNTGAIAMTCLAGVYTNQGTYLSQLSSGSTATVYTNASNTAGYTQLAQSAIRAISCPMNVNMYPGEYLVAFNYSTSVSSVGLSTTALGVTASVYGAATADMQTALNLVPEFTMATGTSVGLYQGMGVHSVTQSAMPATVALSDINQTGSALLQANIAFVFRNQ